MRHILRAVNDTPRWRLVVFASVIDVRGHRLRADQLTVVQSPGVLVHTRRYEFAITIACVTLVLIVVTLNSRCACDVQSSAQ